MVIKMMNPTYFALMTLLFIGQIHTFHMSPNGLCIAMQKTIDNKQCSIEVLLYPYKDRHTHTDKHKALNTVLTCLKQMKDGFLFVKDDMGSIPNHGNTAVPLQY